MPAYMKENTQTDMEDEEEDLFSQTFVITWQEVLTNNRLKTTRSRLMLILTG